MYGISSYSLQVRKFATKNWTQLTTTRGENHRITNLDPDTVYFVRLKSENKYGKGKPSEQGELRTEKGMSLFRVSVFYRKIHYLTREFLVLMTKLQGFVWNH